MQQQYTQRESETRITNPATEHAIIIIFFIFLYVFVLDITPPTVSIRVLAI
jgi:hypothetical protein